ncbi:Aste57867_4122 [Aphanomyces stellatus]|uniref:Aste57867_4122 protein n=1 Tax=Aphanomyces stellatus TaxID=120398 RepID=A0A485KC91_9STRA|nr:hypothetical protein As57867_004111 [Aphanomyces stellatus]VFT81252.1 Aste57867_4122 [Aphanomyces stellatus]
MATISRGYIAKLPELKGFIPINYIDNGLSAYGIDETSGTKHRVGRCCALTNELRRDPDSGLRRQKTGGTSVLCPTLGAKAIGACPAPGQTIDITIQVTAKYKSLIKLNGKFDTETEEYFQTLVQPNVGKEWNVPPGNGVFTKQYVLPTGLTSVTRTASSACRTKATTTLWKRGFGTAPTCTPPTLVVRR